MSTKARNSLRLDHYLELVCRFPLVPIETDSQLETAIALIDELLDKDRTYEEDAYLEVLGNLVEQFEEVAYPIQPASDADVLAELLESKQLTQAALAKRAGIAESTISAVLSGSRNLTRAQMEALATVSLDSAKSSIVTPSARAVHVVPSGGSWVVKRAGVQRALSTHSTKAEAVKAGRARARKQALEVVIQKLNGKIAKLN